MSPLHTRRLGRIAIAAACLLAVAACGNKATPNAGPSPSGSGAGQLNTGTAAPTTGATTATTTSGGGGTQSPYPGNAKDYGLAI